MCCSSSAPYILWIEVLQRLSKSMLQGDNWFVFCEGNTQNRQTTLYTTQGQSEGYESSGHVFPQINMLLSWPKHKRQVADHTLPPRGFGLRTASVPRHALSTVLVDLSFKKCILQCR